MFVDTHCHLNIMTKKEFDVPLSKQQLADAQQIITDAAHADVCTIINVATSLPESLNCILLAQTYKSVFATIGIHPNDCSPEWKKDWEQLEKLLKNKKENKIVGIGECGIDRHWPGYDLQRQKDAFKTQIEAALEHDVALVVHSRDAADETLAVLDEYKNDLTRGVMHCFSYDQAYADESINIGFYLGIGGTLTYPKNNVLRNIVQNVGLDQIVLETDAPFLPPQHMRGKKNHPRHIKDIAEFVAKQLGTPLVEVANITTKNARNLFQID